MDDFKGAEILRQLRELRDLVGHLPNRSQVRKWHQELTESVEQTRRELDNRLDRARSDLDNRIRAVRAEQEHTRATLERRLQWIERQMRFAAGQQEIDLVPDERARQLAQLAEQARSIRAQLIDPALQKQYRSAVQRWQEWQDEHKEQVAMALGASREIAEPNPVIRTIRPPSTPTATLAVDSTVSPRGGRRRNRWRTTRRLDSIGTRLCRSSTRRQ